MAAGNSLARKLRIKPGHRVLVINAPDGYPDLLEPLPEGVQVHTTARGTFDVVHLFVRNMAELERLAPRAIKAAEGDRMFWISWPKKSSGMGSDLSCNRDWEVIATAGLRTAAIISINEVWSALRFRPRDP